MTTDAYANPSRDYRHESDPPATGRAIAALVFGILGVVQLAPFLGPILALALGAGEPSSAGRAARILGWVGLALLALGLFLLLMFFGLIGGAAAFGLLV